MPVIVEDLERMTSVEYEVQLHARQHWTHQLEGYTRTQAWLQKTISTDNLGKFPEGPYEAFVGLVADKLEIYGDYQDIWPELLQDIQTEAQDMVESYNQMIADHITLVQANAYMAANDGEMPEELTEEWYTMMEISDADFEEQDTFTKKVLFDALTSDGLTEGMLARIEARYPEFGEDVETFFGDFAALIRENMTAERCDLYRKLMQQIADSIVDLTGDA